MKKPCDIVQDLLPLYIDDMLKQGTEEFVKEHLFSCAKCKLAKDQLQKAHSWKPNYNVSGIQSEPKGESEFIERIRSYKRRSAVFFILFLFLSSFIFLHIGKTFQDNTSVNKLPTVQKKSLNRSSNPNRD